MIYQTKVVRKEARQFTSTNGGELAGWCHGQALLHLSGWVSRIVIPTLEGDITAQVGDYIIKGLQGEFYPCKPDIFEASYEPVEVTL